jgi:hypothetical protein
VKALHTLAVATTVLLALLAAAPAARAHKFHASLANVDYNAETKTAEISFRLFADDLEASLSRRAGSHVRIGLTDGAERLAHEYVASAFTLRDASGAPLRLEWVGLETQTDVVWIYVQAAAPAGLDGVAIDDRLFFDQFDDQVNLVVVRQGDKKASLSFKPGTPAQTVQLQ